MRDQFRTEPDISHRTERGVQITLPGGLLLPENYPYVETGDFLLDKCRAAWNVRNGNGGPMSFRLVGSPGVGKNAAVYALAGKAA